MSKPGNSLSFMVSPPGSGLGGLDVLLLPRTVS